jgi:hypothetical protein
MPPVWVPGARTFSDQLAQTEAAQKARERTERERAEQYERKLIEEIELEDQRAAAVTEEPPELSPAEMIVRLERRLDSERSGADELRDPSLWAEQDKQRRRRETLRLFRERREAESQTEREIADGTVKRRKAWDERQAQIIEKRTAASRVENQRHAAAIQEITHQANAALAEMPERP